MRNRKINSDSILSVVNVILLIVVTIMLAYPLYFTIIASVSEPIDVVEGNVKFWPVGLTFDGYLNTFKENSIWVGYRNSIVNTFFGTVFSLFLTIPAAYSLSKKKMRGYKAINTYFVFTMYFGGGLLPYYLLVKDIGLMNKPYTLIILGALSVYNIIITRTYFSSSIPESLFEAAEIDGCSEFGKFFRIALPLAKPIVAVISLYYAVGEWNDYFTSLLFINKKDYYPLQTVLKNILMSNQARSATLNSTGMSSEELVYLARQAYMAEAMKYAVIFIASLPMLIAYPFVQKYFTKGVMVGSVKG